MGAVHYQETLVKSALTRVQGMPFAWSLNPYRGCSTSCRYCYAREFHAKMGRDAGAGFDREIEVKINFPDVLRAELRTLRLRELVALGTATDPYQPAERRYGITRKMLEVFAATAGFHLGITTKSDLITRDIDLLREIARANVVDINVTITTLDTALARLLEPRAPRPDLRLNAVRELSQAGICAGVFPNPVMPAITDTEENLEAVAAAAKGAGAQYFGGGPLFLMPAAQKVFFPFLEEQFPHLATAYREQYSKSAYLGKAYKECLRERIGNIREKYALASAPIDYKPELWEDEQPTLFPL